MDLPILSVRHYIAGEEMALWQLFFDTVRQVNSRDYSLVQVQAWAPEKVDEQAWCTRIARNNPFVCVANEQIVGFADLQDNGYIDQFFVHCAWQGRGVGTKLFQAIEKRAAHLRLPELTSNVSITARPFFHRRGFTLVASQEVHLGLVVLRNFRMHKTLPQP